MKRDEGNVEALRGIDLAIRDRDFAAVFGAAGAGKTALIRVLGFLEPPTAGQLLLEGRNVTGLSGEEMAQLRQGEVRVMLNAAPLGDGAAFTAERYLERYFLRDGKVSTRRLGEPPSPPWW